VKPEFYKNLEIYSNFSCKIKDFSTHFHNNVSFHVDVDTQILDGTLEKNPSFQVNKKNDIDSDGVNDDIDNCKNIFNPKQSDSNGDNV
jgi:hypothetical protein